MGLVATLGGIWSYVWCSNHTRIHCTSYHNKHEGLHQCISHQGRPLQEYSTSLVHSCPLLASYRHPSLFHDLHSTCDDFRLSWHHLAAVCTCSGCILAFHNSSMDSICVHHRVSLQNVTVVFRYVPVSRLTQGAVCLESI